MNEFAEWRRQIIFNISCTFSCTNRIQPTFLSGHICFERSLSRLVKFERTHFFKRNVHARSYVRAMILLIVYAKCVFYVIFGMEGTNHVMRLLYLWGQSWFGRSLCRLHKLEGTHFFRKEKFVSSYVDVHTIIHYTCVVCILFIFVSKKSLRAFY